MLNFNQRGFLVPNNNISSSIEELKTVFVDQLWSDKRITLYENYIRYSNDLRTLLEGTEMRQWIDGSFVTKKKEPDDIDMLPMLMVQLLKNLVIGLIRLNIPDLLNNMGLTRTLLQYITGITKNIRFILLIPIIGWTRLIRHSEAEMARGTRRAF